MLNLILIPFTLLLIYLLTSISNFFRNLRTARTTGLPYKFSPVFQSSLFNHIATNNDVYKRIVMTLPASWRRWYDWTHEDYKFRMKTKTYDEIGEDLFLVVSPGGFVLNVADAAVTAEVYSNRSSFGKPDFYETIRPYGDNVVTATEQKWPRQRKLVSGIFNEKNHRVVWRAAISQAMQMLNEWTALSSSTEKRSSGHVITEMQRDVRKTALHVISDAGFGVTLPFSPKGVARDDSYDHMTSAEELSLEEEFSDVKPAPGCDLVYRESLAYMSVEYIRAFVTVLLFPKFLKPFATKTIKHTLNAHRDCGYYLQALIKRARMAKQRGEIEGKENLLASLVTQQEEIKKMLQAEKTEGKAKTMEEITEADVMGNTFIIAIAGHETTAGTLAFAFALLAMNQDKQDWVLKNLDEALEGESEDPMNWDYNVVFPKLISPMALMYETLRLYSPVLAIPKSPIGTAYVHYRGKRCLVPPNTIVELDVPALQYQHKMWGPNSYSFQPEIWDGRRPADPAIEAFSNSVCGGRGHMFPNVHTPQKGSFIPFSDGNRACIGQKFSQVEFAAVMAVVLRKWRVELVMNDSESREEAVKRVQRILDGSTVKLTLMMKEKLEIRLVPR